MRGTKSSSQSSDNSHRLLATAEQLESRQLLSSTVAYWRFENGTAGAPATGTGTILDSSGNGINGTAINSPVYSATVPAATLPQTGAADHRSMSFDGISQRISIPDAPALALTKSLTVEAYFDLRGLDSRLNWHHYIVLRGDNRGGLDPYWLAVQKNSAGQVQLLFQICPASNVSVTLTTTIAMNKWYHVAGTLDDATGQMKLYVNGQLAASTTTTSRPVGPLTGAKPGLGIGNTQSASTSQYFNGLIDEVRISNVALLPSQFLDSPPNKAPKITSLSVSPAAVLIGKSVLLTANSVSDADGKISAVKFYRESNSKPGLQTGLGGDVMVGSDTSSTGGWSASIGTVGMAAGSYTYYAQATDNVGALSNVVSNSVTLKVQPVATDVLLFWAGYYTQTSTAPPTTLTGYYFTDRAFMKTADDFTGGTLKYPGPKSPGTLTPMNPTLLQYGSGYSATRATLDAAYPFGTYTTTITNPGTGASEIVSISHATDAFSANLPALTPATFTSMQGMNAKTAFTFNFNSFAKGNIATASNVYLTITNVATSQVVVYDGPLPSTTTAVTVPANTLLPNTKYRVSLNFDNRIVDKSGTTRTTAGFDVTTNATFTTGV
jgi:hypothetical protein